MLLGWWARSGGGGAVVVENIYDGSWWSGLVGFDCGFVRCVNYSLNVFFTHLFEYLVVVVANRENEIFFVTCSSTTDRMPVAFSNTPFSVMAKKKRALLCQTRNNQLCNRIINRNESDMKTQTRHNSTIKPCFTKQSKKRTSEQGPKKAETKFNHQ